MVVDVYERHSESKTFRRTVTRKGNWSRVDDERNGIATHWSNLANGASVNRWRGPRGETIQLYGPAPLQPVDEAPPARRLDQADQLVGETCQVWEVVRTSAYGYGRRDLSCRTADGLTLWSRTEDSGGVIQSMRATSLIRRPVRRSEVRPPADLIARRRLFGAATSRPASGWEVSLQSWRGGDVQVIRRSGAWTVDQNSPPLRGFTIQNSETGLRLQLTRADERQAMSLSVHRMTGLGARPQRVGPEIGPPDRIVLGEPCWVPKPPPSVDPATGEALVVITSGHNNSCYSHDGMLLHYDRGHRVFFSGEAIRFQRGPRSLDAILPKAMPLSLKDWGLD